MLNKINNDIYTLSVYKQKINDKSSFSNELNLHNKDEKSSHTNKLSYENIKGITLEEIESNFADEDNKAMAKSLRLATLFSEDEILILAIPEVREMLDVKIFVDTDADEMLLRRMERDINERARTFDCVKTQYLESVKPMYLEFCEPSKRYSDIIIPRGGQNKIAINMILAKLKKYLQDGTLSDV